jgi:hypothetical protein
VPRGPSGGFATHPGYAAFFKLSSTTFEHSSIAIGTWFLGSNNYYTTEIFDKKATLQVRRELLADDFVRFCLKRWRKVLLRRK